MNPLNTIKHKYNVLEQLIQSTNERIENIRTRIDEINAANISMTDGTNTIDLTNSGISINDGELSITENGLVFENKDVDINGCILSSDGTFECSEIGETMSGTIYDIYSFIIMNIYAVIDVKYYTYNSTDKTLDEFTPDVVPLISIVNTLTGTRIVSDAVAQLFDDYYTTTPYTDGCDYKYNYYYDASVGRNVNVVYPLKCILKSSCDNGTTFIYDGIQYVVGSTEVVLSRTSSGGAVVITEFFTGINGLPINLSSFFSAASSITINKYSISSVAGTGETETVEIMLFDTFNCINMSRMFSGSWASFDLSLLNTSQVVNMSAMFASCSSIGEMANMNSLDTSQCTDMSYMFNVMGMETNIDTLDVTNFDTSCVVNMSYMFYGVSCYFDISKFDTSSVTDMSCMFMACSKLTIIDISHFDTSHVSRAYSMFASCYNLNSITFYSDVSKIDFCVCTNFDYMFVNCQQLTSLNLSSFNMSSCVSMLGMFESTIKLTTITLSSKFDLSNCLDLSNLFTSSYASTNGFQLVDIPKYSTALRGITSVGTTNGCIAIYGGSNSFGVVSYILSKIMYPIETYYNTDVITLETGD